MSMEGGLIYLTVSYRDKDIVKALGARWDGKARRWFIGAGASRERFQRWIKDETASESPIASEAVTPPNEELKAVDAMGPVERQAASLASILFETSEAVRKAWPAPRWIMAEVAAIRTNANSGHTYLELVEHDASGREIAKASARIWSGSARILKQFERATGGALSAGMKIMFQAQAEFSIQYGFGLTIEALDASWSLGEMERKLREIRERLAQEGLLDLNRGLELERDFFKVGVIAPEGAAGLGDFMADAKKLEARGLCAFEFFPAVFEGPTAKGSLGAALDRAREWSEIHAPEALVIIRGGGATTSLNWLNEYELAARLCVMKTPVLTGIGHERDSTILDEVANLSFDTPSKVVGFIVNQIVLNANEAKNAWTSVQKDAQRVWQNEKQRLLELKEAILTEAQETAAAAAMKTEGLMRQAQSDARRHCEVSKTQVEALGREILGLGPRRSMERGYAVVRQNGAPVGRKEQLSEAPIVIEFADGAVNANVIKQGDGNERK